MKKISVDIKNGKFVTYPGGDELSSLSGYINRSYFKQVGQSTQLKIVIVDKNIEYTLNCIANGLIFKSLVTECIEASGELNLVIKKIEDNDPPYFIVKNEL